MNSRQFFGYGKGCKDITITLYNDNGEKIYENSCTTFYNVHPLIKEEVEVAICSYKKNWVQKGEPIKCEIYTAPSGNLCTIDLITKKRIFNNW